MAFPKLAAKYGSSVNYAQGRNAHSRVGGLGVADAVTEVVRERTDRKCQFGSSSRSTLTRPRSGGWRRTITSAPLVWRCLGTRSLRRSTTRTGSRFATYLDTTGMPSGPIALGPVVLYPR